MPIIEQGVLPLEPAAAGLVQLETTDELPARRNLRRCAGGRHPGRRRLPADLPRERIEIVPPASEWQFCTVCDSAKVRIGADLTEELDYAPASFVIREYVRLKYACGGCQQGVVQAVLPARPIGEGTTGAGVIGARGHLQVRGSSAVVSAGADLSSATECKSPGARSRKWNGAVAAFLRSNPSCASVQPGAGAPVAVGFNATTRPWRYRTRVGAPEISHSGIYGWYRGELGEVVYDFTWSRNRDGPLKMMLANYRGYLPGGRGARL